MDHLKQSWAGTGILCPFCRHLSAMRVPIFVPAFSPVVVVEPERSAESNLFKPPPT